MPVRETMTHTIEAVQKGQTVRLWDVFAVGPGMIAIATQARQSPEWLRLFIAAAGIATILYNGSNWVINNQRLKRLSNGRDEN